MKIALVSTYTHPIALGLRYISSYLKAAGHEVEMLFMSSKRATARADYSEAVLEDFVERLRDCDLIGMSLMTNTFLRASVLTQQIRDAGIRTPIIWGGTHPTVAPDESLEVADIVCVGEGEEPMLQLVEQLEAGKDPKNIPSLGFRGGGPFGNEATFRNPVMSLAQKLDDIPFPDYELETHWIVGDGGLEPARLDNLRGTLHRLRVETTRGCPYQCTFCNNAVWLKIHKGKGKWVRTRSTDNVIAEIRRARECFPTIEEVNIIDDLFFIRSEEEIEEFAAKYMEHVNLPLELDAFPNTITEAKVRLLSRVPIALISMGIQSGSEDTLKNIYRRPTPLDKIIASIDLFKRYRIRAEYHYIVNNPFEPDENVIETMRFIASHHRSGAVLRVFPLAFFPGTPLYDRACADGKIVRRDDRAYQYVYTGNLQFAKHDYLSVWLRVVLYLRNIGLPRWPAHRIVDLVTHPLTRRCIDRKWFLPVAYGVYVLGRKLIRNLIYQPFVRPFKYLRRKPRYQELHPEDEVTLPRSGAEAGDTKGRRRGRSKTPQPTARWTVPKKAGRAPGDSPQEREGIEASASSDT